MIEFQTRYSGSLFVKKCVEKITMELPLNATAKQVQEGNTVDIYSYIFTDKYMSYKFANIFLPM